jgi:hypothetical protein
MFIKGRKRSEEYPENQGTVFTPSDVFLVPAEAEDQATAAALNRATVARTPDIDEGRELQERGRQSQEPRS